MASLADRLADRIRRDGPLRFDRFQEAALYDPDGGYYERPGRVGRDGDFVTGASWHPAFARALARIVDRLRPELGDVELVDAGCGEGELLGFLHESEPGLRLTGVERSEVRRALARQRAPSARLVADLAGLAPVRGLVIAYELVDALPVRSFRHRHGRLHERVVGLDGAGGFVFLESPCPDGDAILGRLAGRGVRLEEGQVVEVRDGAPVVARQLASALLAGLLLVFDYGAPARALYGPVRPYGTLEAFRAHQVTRDVLSDPGSRDLTAWVDFTELEETLTAAGLVVHGLVSQSRLLLSAGIAGELADDPEALRTAQRQVERNAIGKLFLPGGMGESLRVLVASRGTSAGVSLLRGPSAPGSGRDHG